jgi:hypothetical protein
MHVTGGGTNAPCRAELNLALPMTHAARGPEEGSGRLGAMILKPFSDSHGCGLVQVSSQNPHFRQYPPNLLDGPFVEGVRFQVTLSGSKSTSAIAISIFLSLKPGSLRDGTGAALCFPTAGPPKAGQKCHVPVKPCEHKPPEYRHRLCRRVEWSGRGPSAFWPSSKNRPRPVTRATDQAPRRRRVGWKRRGPDASWHSLQARTRAKRTISPL